MSFILGLVFGCGIGAVGHYYLQQFRANCMDAQELAHTRKNDMVELFAQFPYQMNLIKSNLSDPEYKNIREFFVVDKTAIMSSSVPRLRYDLSEEVLSLVTNLEQLGCIERLEHDSLLYRIEEDFLIQLQLKEANS
jgi:hypothetical protein